MKIGVLNSGGDCPGLNAVINGVVGAADKLGWEVLGFRDGFEGLLPDGCDYMTLTPDDTSVVAGLGGTILGTTNKGNFAAKVGVGDVAKIPAEIMDKARDNVNKLGLAGLVIIGGDGSLTTALQMSEEGFDVVGVPKTIDNDLQATSMTFGFDSAVSSVVDALDRLHTTAQSHKRVMVLEVMGRHAGWIALWGAIGGGANAVLIPEIDARVEKVAQFIIEREKKGKRSSLVVVAEGAKILNGGIVTRCEGEASEVSLGGAGEMVAKELYRLTGKDTRACTLGHLQRGGSPTALDRVLSARFGVKAVKLIAERRFGCMVSYKSGEVSSVPIADAVNQLRLVDPDGEVVQTARALGICLGD
ncbi:MAG: 6-phosphofructokinase [Akkermansiaceae bacterium]|nr:6-phosphofructokinase [Akkermansiaceae bacterium]